MTDKTQPTAHAEITAPISADLRRMSGDEQPEALQQSSQPDALAEVSKEQYARMFNAACEALGQISDHLGIDSDIDPGAEPIIEAIDELRAAALQAALQAAPPAPAAVAVPPLTPDEARRAARTADLMRGPSDTTQPAAYAMAGALALAAKLAVPPAQEQAVNCGMCGAKNVTPTDIGDCPRCHWDELIPAPAQEHATQLAGQGQAFEPTAYFGLAAEQIDKLRTSGLKPEEIAGDDPAAQLNRVRELVWWFARFADGHANPKWLRGHAFELAYYIACMDVKRGIDLEPVKKAAFKEGAMISATDRAVLEHIGVLPAAPTQAQEDAARLDAMQAQRIAVIPEFEGPWDATIYGDSDEPIISASGNTPREAIDAARAAQGCDKP